MSDQRMARLMGPLGLVILVLLFLGFGPISGNTPDQKASGASVVSSLTQHGTRQMFAFYLVAVAVGLLLFYGTALRTKLRGAEGGGTFLSTTAFAGVLMTVAGVIVVGVVHFALLLAAHNNLPDVARTLNFVDNNDFWPIQFGVAVITIPSGLSILNRSTLPRWLGWVSLVIGVVACIGPLGFFGILAFALWLPVAGFVIGRHDPAAARKPTAVPDSAAVT